MTKPRSRTTTAPDPLGVFDALFPSPSWGAWRIFIKAMYALPLAPAELAVYTACTGRTRAPTSPASRVVAICGRRSGKSRIAAFLGAFYAGWRDYSNILSLGETGQAIVTAASREQAAVIFDAAVKFLEHVPATKAMITRQTADTIELSNHTAISIKTANLRLQRGPTGIVFIGDEASFWNAASGAPNQDREVLNAAEPSLLTTGGPIILISTPYARSGIVFDEYDQHYGVEDDDTLIWMSDSATMNPSLDATAIAKAFRRDPEWAASEYGRGGRIQFRQDLSNLFSAEALNACVLAGRPLELPPQPGVQYVAHVDSSGGSDESFALSVAHKNAEGRAVVDLVREWPAPFDPLVVVADCADLLRRYGCAAESGDKYSSQWIVSAFRQQHITYQANDLNKSQLFLETVALVNSRMVELPSDVRMINQFSNLQRRTGTGGRDSIDHRAGQKDDLCNAVAGCLVLATRSGGLLTLPADFRTCNRVTNNMPATDTCYLYGGHAGPVADVLCRECIGNKAVKAALAAHQKATGEMTNVVQFYKARYPPNERAAWAELCRHQSEWF
jgi:hypothetical protein